MYKDNVICCNCEFEGLVDYGSESCPQCKQEGFLAWKDGVEQEVYCK